MHIRDPLDNAQQNSLFSFKKLSARERFRTTIARWICFGLRIAKIILYILVAKDIWMNVTWNQVSNSELKYITAFAIAFIGMLCRYLPSKYVTQKYLANLILYGFLEFNGLILFLDVANVNDITTTYGYIKYLWYIFNIEIFLLIYSIEATIKTSFIVIIVMKLYHYFYGIITQYDLDL